MQIHDHAAALIRDVETAFSNVPYPGDERIDSDHCLECREYADFYRGKHWKELRPEDLKASSLGFMKDDVFRFYLPCFLIATLHVHYYQDHVSELVENAIDSILSLLAERGDLLKRFDREQRLVVRRYLEFLRDEACPWASWGERIDLALRNLPDAE